MVLDQVWGIESDVGLQKFAGSSGPMIAFGRCSSDTHTDIYIYICIYIYIYMYMYRERERERDIYV